MLSCTQKRLNKELEDYSQQQYYQSFINSSNIIKFFDSLQLKLYTLDQDPTQDFPFKLIISQPTAGNQIILEMNVPKYYPFKPFCINHYYLNQKKRDISYYQFLGLINNSRHKIYDRNILNFFF